MYPTWSRTNLDPLPAEDADHRGQGEEEEAGEADGQDQDHALVSLRGLRTENRVSGSAVSDPLSYTQLTIFVATLFSLSAAS